MKDAMEHLGPRLKEIRSQKGISLREVSRLLSVSPSFLSQIENGKSQPSVATLYSIAKLLNISVDALFDAKPNESESAKESGLNPETERENYIHPTAAWGVSRARISAVNPLNRSVITMDSGVRWERLAATSEVDVNFMEIFYGPGAETNKTGSLIFHDGFEYGFALEGELELTIGDAVLSLAAGHSVGFDSSLPHRFRNLGSSPFRGIWFVHGCSAAH